MLMDEPFGAVDPIVRERLQNEFLRLQDELAKTILFVTHDIDEAIKMGDLVAVMQAGGRLAQFGPPAEILANPASDFVARFVGADRGLKRLSLVRVGELTHVRPAAGPPGSRTPPRPAAASRPIRFRFPTCSWSTPTTGRSAGSTTGDLPATGRLGRVAPIPMSPLLDRRDHAQGRPVDAPRRRRPGRASSSTGRSGSGAIVTLDVIVAELSSRPVGQEAGRWIRWDWIVDNLEVIGGALAEHLILTVLAVVDRACDQLRRPPCSSVAGASTRTRHGHVRGPVHDPEPGPVRVPRPVHRADAC